MLDCSTISAQIRFLLQSLNDSNSDDVYRDLCEFCEFGTEESILILQTCFDHMKINRTETSDLKNMLLDAVFGSIFKYILDKPKFSTVFCQAIGNASISEEFLESLSKTLNLSTSERICIGLALSDSENSGIRICGNNYCLSQMNVLCANPGSVLSSELIQNIITFLHQSEGLNKHIDSFMRMLSLVPLEESTQFILAPLLSDNLPEDNFMRNLDFSSEGCEDDFDVILAEVEKERSMDAIFMELGYGCTMNSLQCKEILSVFLPLTEVSIAKMFARISCTHTGIEDQENSFSALRMALGSNNLSDSPSLSSWNIDILLESIEQLVPGINWIHVFEKMDHEGFYLPNEEAFSNLLSLYRRVSQDPFPLDVICGSVWMNTKGQLSFLKYATLAPPEKFTFAHSVRPLGYMDLVHDHKFQLGHANHAWLCHDLLNVLCQLAERGAVHFRSVQSILEYPLECCPEVLLLGIANVNTAYNLLQYEVLSRVFPVIIGNSMGGGMIRHLWHVNHNLVLQGFVESYNVNPANMTRILIICHEIKILSAVLRMIPSSFGIRLAALAFRDELVDLEKWLKDNLSTYKDVFFEECLKFIKEIDFSPDHQVSANPFSHSDAITNLYTETSSIFLKVLQAQSSSITSSQVYEEMERLTKRIAHAGLNLDMEGATDSSVTGGYADDIEAEANSYFRQMFSGQLTIDAMIQLLAKFKESSDTREKSIFDCIIANLVEEYRFFPKYPETQLKIAAILFGSVIKNQLVTHLTLGIALRFVLDGLRKPPDSRMFLFGSKALDQFLDRLIEWPQYCNHILQISHLRGTQPEVVLFVEQCLARISSGHSESHGGNNAFDDPNHSSNMPNYEMHGSSLQYIGSGTTQPRQQLSSPSQLQHKHTSSLEERHNNSTNIPHNMKPLVSSAGQPAVVPLGDSASTKKSLTINAPGMVSSSPSFVRPSRGNALSTDRPHSSNTGFGSALNIETLVAAAEKRDNPVEAPPSEIQDKISFIINNISTANLEVKAQEFAEIMKEEYYLWFAQYMVMKRASIEPNFHELYLKFIDKVNSKALRKEIVQATYENCKVLLGSELIKSSSEERSLLKNLGSWLGKFTLGRNQFLAASQIDPKSLIIEAYEKGLMIAVVPFASKILEACRNSVVYKHTNPWTAAILGLLVEIYEMPNLKMNLKFEIEVLFKKLAIELKEIKPSAVLQDRKRVIEGDPDFSSKDPPQLVAEVKSGAVSAQNHIELPLELTGPSLSGVHTQTSSQRDVPRHLLSSTFMEDEKLTSLGHSDQLSSVQGQVQAITSHPQLSTNQLPTPIPNIGTHVIINMKLSSLGLHLPFQRVVPIAMDRAIKEIVAGIVQRSVSIATQTTKELVLKDYAMESDETRIYNAAHLMVASLSGSLAHVTCKEHLRGCISSQLRSALQGLNIVSDLLEQAVLLVTNDNLDLGCAVIEQAATDKALQSIDGEIAQQLSLRRKPREAAAPTFYESNIYTQNPMGAVPEPLRPKPGGVSLSQQRVYEDFVRFPWQNQSSQSTTSAPASPPALSISTGLSHIQGLQSGHHSPNVVSSGLETADSRALESVSEEMDSGVIHQSSVNYPVSSHSAIAVAPEELRSSSQTVTSTSATEHFGSTITEPLLNTRDALDRYHMVAQKLETSVDNDATEADIQEIISEVSKILHKCISRDEAALAIAQKVFKGLYENASSSVCVGAHLAMLAAVRDVCKLVVKELTTWVIYLDEERKFNKDIIIGLIRGELLNLAEYNLHMAKLLDGGRNKVAMEFSISLLHTLRIEEPSLLSELHNLVDALTKVATRPESPESVQQLIEIVRNPGVVVLEKEDKGRLSRDKKVSANPAIIKEDYVELVEPDPTGFRDQVTMLFAEWYRICEVPGSNDTACSNYFLTLQQNGLLKGDEMSARFFRILTEISVSHCLSSDVINSGSIQSQPLSFLAIDIYSKLVSSILKYSSTDQGSLKLLYKILNITVSFIQKDAEEKKGSFNPRPYFRLFINWLHDLGSLDHVFEGASFQGLLLFASAFLNLQPLKVPAFSFAWLELVSHRNFMPKLLTGNPQKGWPSIQRLLVSLFQYLEPFLRNAELSEPVHFLYKGTLRVLLVLLHDFPEFLCDYHFTFCDVIPPSCIQMRNIILSAFPRNMKLPDPSTPNLKIDLLAETSQAPRILSEVDAALNMKHMKTEIDEYLKTRQQGSSFLSEMKQRLLLLPSEAGRAGTRYNVPLINSLVLYVGMQAIQQLQARTPPQTQSMSNPWVFMVGAVLDIFQTLVVDLDTEGRYLYLNAVANQLRYPNNHTHYFSFILLFLFSDSDQEIIQEQITRVLLERLIANRPHPWGLLITFLELIKNPRYNFWNRSFIRCAPEIEKLFESVSRSIGGPKPTNEDPMVSV